MKNRIHAPHALFIIFIICNVSTNLFSQTRQLRAKINYSYSCLSEKSQLKKINDLMGDADEFVNSFMTKNLIITDQQQNIFGEKFFNELKKHKEININTEKNINIKFNYILNKLLSVRDNPSKIKYRICILNNDSTINAYTLGGVIYINKAIINKCINEDQLYCIIGHEIGHNEMGHIKSTLKQSILSDKYLGNFSSSFLFFKKELTSPFNQRKELEADYYGMNLSWKLGYDICSIKLFWDEIAKDEKYNILKDLFSTHPYSEGRSKCLLNHIKNNFEIECR